MSANPEPSTTSDHPSDHGAALRGRLLLVIAAILWSLSGVLVKSTPLQALPIDDRGPLVACFRALIAAAALLPFVRWRAVRLHWGLVPMVLSFATMNVLFVSAMTITTAAAAIFLQYTATVWAFVFGTLFLREKVTRENLIALGFGLAGIAWIVAGNWSGGDFLGILLALGSGVGYGGVVVSLRALHREDSAWLVVLNHLVAGAILIPWVVSRGVVPDVPQWGVIAALGVLQMGLPYVLFCRGVAHVSSQEAALITLLEAVLNPLWVFLVWGERVTTATWVGGGLIIAGLLLRYVRIPGRS